MSPLIVCLTVHGTKTKTTINYATCQKPQYNNELNVIYQSILLQHYKKSLTTSFDRYPNANYLVILEEDLDISVDILTYFKQLLPVLENDESLYCISAWNDQVSF